MGTGISGNDNCWVEVDDDKEFDIFSISVAVFACLNNGFVGSNPTRVMDVYMHLPCSCCHVHRLIPRPRSLTDCVQN
jgi:hypothetical protein